VRLDCDLAVESLTDLATDDTSFEPATTLPVAGHVVPDRNSYDFRLVVSRKMYDKAVGTAKSPALAGLGVGAAVYLNPRDIERLGTTAGREVRVSSTRTSIILPVRADDGVLKGTAWIPFNQSGTDVRELLSADQAVTDVRVETI
jgi:anaerobic selenocysteine-containing dehydrogenase